MVVPIKAELRHQLDRLAATITSATRDAVDRHRRHLAQLTRRLRDPRALLRQMRQRLDGTTIALRKALAAEATTRRVGVHELEARLRYPAAALSLVAGRRERVGILGARLHTAMRGTVDARRFRLGAQAHRLDAVSPLRVLDRGYAVVTNLRDGRAVVDARQVEVGDDLAIRVAQGRIGARATHRDN
jgi:exodeoxyribonuclease VII large subunit